MPEGLPTGDITVTSATVNPAQPTPQFDPNATIIQTYEQRVRSLMSEKDRAQNAYQQAVQERVTTQAELDRIRTEKEAALMAATQAAEATLAQLKAKEQEAEKQRAINLKLMRVLQNPELAPYADLIPETTDEASLDAAVARLKQARDADLSRFQQQAPQTPPQTPSTPQFPSLSALYPQSQVPPANPARPAAGQGPSSADQIAQMLREAKMESEMKRDRSIYAIALERAKQMQQAQS